MGVEVMMNETSSVASESPQTEASPDSTSRKIPFIAMWGTMLVKAMIISKKGYMKTRTSRYRNGDIQRQRKGKRK
jgi:hypothetical protein